VAIGEMVIGFEGKVELLLDLVKSKDWASGWLWANRRGK